MNDTTQQLRPETASELLPDSRSLACLIVLWCAEEPWRMGEVLFAPPAHGKAGIFGRGDTPPVSGQQRLVLARQRPDGLHQSAPMAVKALSRNALELQEQDDALRVRRIDQASMRYRDQRCDEALLRPGEMLELDGILLLLAARRTLPMPGAPGQLPARLPPFGRPDEHRIVGESPLIWALRQRIAEVGPREVPVLIHGETGTGKELVAAGLHNSSSRRNKALCAFSAAGVPLSLVEAELFGNLRDYPNPGMRERSGHFGAAANSSLFMDEIGEFSPEAQAALLRAIDPGEYQRLGDSTVCRTLCRIITATNQPLSRLKPELLGRLNAVISTPSLKERREDIPLLVCHLLQTRLAAEDRRIAARFFLGGSLEGEPRLGPSLIKRLVHEPLPYNVRDLITWLWKSIDFSPGDTLELPEQAPQPLVRPVPPIPPKKPDNPHYELDPDERQRLESLRHLQFDVPRAAVEAYQPPVSRNTAHRHLRVLCCKALLLSQGQWAPAARLLAGSAPISHHKLEQILMRTVKTFRDRAVRVGQPAFERWLRKEYGRSEAVVLAVLALPGVTLPGE